MSPLERAETPFNDAQALIDTGGIFGGQRAIIGLNHLLAVYRLVQGEASKSIAH